MEKIWLYIVEALFKGDCCLADRKKINPDISPSCQGKYEELYKLHSGYLKEYFRKRVKDPHMREDYLSETFIRILKHADDIIGKTEHEQRMLITIYAKNVLINASDYEKRHGFAVFSGIDTKDEEGEEIDFEETIEACQNTQDAAVDHELKNALKAELQKLDPVKRQALTMMYYGNMKTDEIAEELGMNPSTLRSMLSNTYKYLRKRLKEYL